MGEVGVGAADGDLDEAAEAWAGELVADVFVASGEGG
jgi:hypothetical protein